MRRLELSFAADLLISTPFVWVIGSIAWIRAMRCRYTIYRGSVMERGSIGVSHFDGEAAVSRVADQFTPAGTTAEVDGTAAEIDGDGNLVLKMSAAAGEPYRFVAEYELEGYDNG